MSDDLLKNLLSESDATPEPDRKQRNIDLATEAFSKEISNQGNASLDRPMEDNTLSFPANQERKESMNQTYESNRWMYGGLASAAVLVLTVTLVVNQKVLIGGEDFDANLDVVAADYTSQAAPVLEEATISELMEMTRDGQLKQQNSKRTAEFSRRAMSEKGEQAKLESLMAQPSLSVMAEPDYVAAGDAFENFETNSVKLVREEPVSTFSIDVDTASYSYVRKQLQQGVLPQKASIRLEELVNYFSYEYPAPASPDTPFEPTVSVMPSPWNAQNRLVHIGIKGYEVPEDKTVRSNLVFLLDVSGSMSEPDKLPLVKRSLNLLLGQLHPEDTIAIVVYAGAAGAVLEPTKVRDRHKIKAALEQLEAGGSTAGAQGIKLAYQLAESTFIDEGINRIILATDGDFNVGLTDHEQLMNYVERKRDNGVYLSVLGFGQGNYQDALMQKLAQNGNGIASYIDSLAEARKVLVDEARSQLFPIANDVKIQVEFNPETVSEYRLLGYETRALNREDFNNDKVDAGEIGSGHTVTEIYEITPRGQEGLVDGLRYSPDHNQTRENESEYGFLKMRYKIPGETKSRLINQPISMNTSNGSLDSRFSVAVAGFAQLIKDAKHTGDWNLDSALALAQENRGDDPYGYRAEFVQLIRAAMVADETR
jgi:Ca-activated chloride channel family protein